MLRCTTPFGDGRKSNARLIGTAGEMASGWGAPRRCGVRPAAICSTVPAVVYAFVCSTLRLRPIWDRTRSPMFNLTYPDEGIIAQVAAKQRRPRLTP